MRAARWCLLWLALVPAVPAATGQAGLPRWSEADQELLKDGILVPGSGLFGEQRVTAEPGAGREQPALPVELPPPDQPEVGDTTIPEEYLADYFASRPASFLLDPQKLLSRQEQRDRVGFLRYHSDDSEVDLYVYLFDGPQEIPAEVRAEELVERMFGEGKPAAVVFYFLGVPQKAELHLSPSLAETVSVAERQRALQSSVAEALEKADPVDQLERFTVQMSIRLYWMEKTLGGSGADAGPLVVLAAKPPQAEPRKWWQPWLERLRAWGVPAAVAGGVAVLGALAWWWHGARARHRFPEIEVAPRLGGEHGAGVGAVITFGSAGLPPSFQREQVPDYLRRM